MIRRKEIKKAHVAAAILSAAMLLSSNPVLAANYSGTNLTNGGTTHFDKYLVMDEGTNVPNATFGYTITGANNARSYDIAGHKVQILDGLGTPTITWDSHDETVASTVKFAPGDTTVKYSQWQESAALQASDQIKGLADGEKYAKHTATVDFSSVTYPEPGIYRYKIEEAATTQLGIVNDTNLVRYLDVYVMDDGNGKLSVEGYILHSSATDAPMNETTYGTAGGTQSDNKSQGYTNDYTTYDLTFSKNVSGNQASHDKYFKFHVAISGATAGTVYDVSYGNDNNANTTDGSAETAPTTNSATVYTNMSNPTTITVGANGSVEQDFYLQHGQSIAIRGIAHGTQYSVEETPEDYKPATTATEGTINAAGTNATVASASRDNVIAMTNTRNGSIPTGVIVSVLPFGVAALLAGTSFAVFRSKKEEEDETEE